ncbi:hypothetical protein GCM10023346_23850 [Arthrobacter gyeryongensis]|uniref:Uncharacterized protein n=1 Tax=Arthrobacter gyeryongensis TaxID=1650592 RepID=A0ABP9SH95_9MICC
MQQENLPVIRREVNSNATGLSHPAGTPTIEPAAGGHVPSETRTHPVSPPAFFHIGDNRHREVD